MNTIVFSEDVEIPPWIVDHASFRRWACSKDYPERGKVSYLAGKIWVDVSVEKLIHNLLKQAVALAIGNFALTKRLGRFIGDRMMLTNVLADLSTEPDGMFVTNKAIQEGRVILSEGEDSLEVEGSPDMLLEVVSKSSVKKDTRELKRLYWNADIAEHWLIDSRPAEPTFTLYRRGTREFQPSRKRDGWLRSDVFDALVRLRREEDDTGLPLFHIDLK